MEFSSSSFSREISSRRSVRRKLSSRIRSTGLAAISIASATALMAENLRAIFTLFHALRTFEEAVKLGKFRFHGAFPAFELYCKI
jgi:hypothetical protein